MNKSLWMLKYNQFKNGYKLFKKIDENFLLNRDVFKLKNNNKPEPPEYPSLDDCCRSGCTDCVFVVYNELYCKYEEEIIKWNLENSESFDLDD